ncbi:MAG: ATP-dependent Clp protease proteolytic subunit [Flavobacteriaceae bacterium]|nr:ATP-dependent Clp protease proteolytic subunit [Flavobacteriaceae bacterium]
MRKTLLQLPATKDNGALLITAEVKNKVAYLSIDGYIGRWGDASTTNLKNNVKTLKDEGATTAEVYLNTEGGDCFQANEMCNILDDAFQKENVSLKVGALAASAGTKILVHYRKKASCKKNSRFMIHKPSMYIGGNEDKIKAQLKLLENITAEYKAEYAESFGMTEDEVEKLWVNDYWMDAKEAKKKGMVATIENDTLAIDTEARMKLVAAGDPNIPDPIIEPETNPKTENMNKEVLAASLGLPSTATEAEITAKIAENKAKAEQSVQLQAKMDQQEKDGKAAKITALLNKGEADKKFTGDQRANLQAMAEASFEATEKFIDALLPLEKIDINAAGKTHGATGANPDTKGWKYENYANAGAKGAELLAILETEDPVAYATILDEAMPELNPS